METKYQIHECLRLGAREEQQDAHASYRSEDGTRTLCVVSDGVGGQSGGRLASKAVIETARERWEAAKDTPALNAVDFLSELARESHERINRIADTSGTRARATLVALLISDGSASWIHSGDSRLYYFRDGVLQRRTRDHSVVQVLLDRDKITESEMGTHPDQGRLLQTLGGEDYGDPDGDETCLTGGSETFLLCTDGFWEHLEAREIAQLGAGKLDKPEALLESLADQSVSRGAEKADNLAAILVRTGDRKNQSVAGIRSAPSRRTLVLGVIIILIVFAVYACLRCCRNSAPAATPAAPIDEPFGPPRELMTLPNPSEVPVKPSEGNDAVDKDDQNPKPSESKALIE